METLQEWTGQLVRQAREERGYSQQYVADEVEIDIRTLKKIEEGKSDPHQSQKEENTSTNGFPLRRSRCSSFVTSAT